MRDVILLFLRLGCTAFGGPAAHVAVIERECVRQRQWLSHEQFVDLLGVSNLVPGPTSTELAMHVGRVRAGWPGLLGAGLAFILPSALMVAGLAALYVHSGDLPLVRRVVLAVQPIVPIVVLDALLPLSRSTIRTAPAAGIAIAAVAAALAGIPEVLVILCGGAMALFASRLWPVSVVFAVAVVVHLAAQSPHTIVTVPDLFTYFVVTGSLLFGSGYVLFPVLEGDLVQARHWLSPQQLVDAIAAGQATPGPVFTTATFVGFVIGGPAGAAAATVGMFLPAFVFAALSSVSLERLRRSAMARRFLSGVNAAAVALIALTVVALMRAAFTGWPAAAAMLAAALLVFGAKVRSTALLAVAAAVGVAWAAIG